MYTTTPRLETITLDALATITGGCGKKQQCCPCPPPAPPPQPSGPPPAAPSAPEVSTNVSISYA
jgi:hypothetical protein